MGKRERLASVIVGGINWLSTRSDRVYLLAQLVAERLILTEQMVLPRPQHRFTPTDLEAGTATYNEASERYFAEQRDRADLLGKPYTDRVNFARRLFDVGVLTHWLRLSPGEVVAELGAGTCWLSHLLNRFGCRTIAIDVSESALALGRSVFERDALTRWDLDPQFLVYDGHRLPLPDEHVDKLVVYDAFHHIPNQAEILREMARVLKRGGVVAMCEPGKGHGHSETSRLETEEWGVLENDIFVEELGPLAKSCGFHEVTVVPVNLPLSIEVPADQLRDFLLGKSLRHYWSLLAQSFQDMSYIVLYKDRYVPTTRKPQVARARIGLSTDRLPVMTGERARLTVRLANDGDTRWLHDVPDGGGETRLGGHLHAAERGGPALDYDWLRQSLPHDLDPGDSVTLDVELPALDIPGHYRVVFDVVAEQVLWFANRDSPTTELRLDVGPSHESTPSQT